MRLRRGKRLPAARADCRPRARARRVRQRPRRRRRQRGQRQRHQRPENGGLGRRVRDRHRELSHRPEHRRDHRRHDQVRNVAPAVGHLRRLLVDPEGRAGLHRLPQRREGRRRGRRARSTRSSWSPRTTRTTAETTFANVQSLVDDDNVFGLFNVVGTKNNLAIRDYVNENCVPNLLAATGSPAWGNHDYPWLLGTPRAVPARDAGVRRLPRRRTSPTRRSRSCAPTTTSARSYSETLKALIEGTDLTIADEQTYDPDTGEVGRR